MNQNLHYETKSIVPDVAKRTGCSKRPLKWQIQSDLLPVEPQPQWQLHTASLDLQNIMRNIQFP